MKTRTTASARPFFFLRTLAFMAFVVLPAARPVQAHPVPRETHDRTIAVHLKLDAKTGQVIVEVKYRLEVDEFTVITDDLKPFQDEVDTTRKNSAGFYGEFTRIYAPIYANHLIAEANGKPLTFSCVERGHTLTDENRTALGHLRCDFVFAARFTPRTDAENEFKFREGNYELQEGKILLSLTADASLKLTSKTEPSRSLQERPPRDRDPGDEDALRQAAARFVVSRLPSENAAAVPAPRPPSQDHDDSLRRLLLDTNYGFWLVMLLSAWFGAVHALTPGHGKTLVAAYLVGQQGTVWHAMLLGLVTTVTHTGVVILLAAGLRFMPQSFADKAGIQAGLGLVMGLIVAGLGLWLLLKRLSGGHDHIHLGGGHHHHHHGHEHAHHHHDHTHADHDHTRSHDHADLSAARLNTWGLIVLGVTGGIIPCWDAIALLFWTMGTREFWLALPALLAFSAGLAGVLILIGVLVVKVRAFAGSRLGAGRLVRSLPMVSALCVTAIGVWLCYVSIGGGIGGGIGSGTPP